MIFDCCSGLRKIILSILLMEQAKEQGRSLNFQAELQNLSNLQAKIEETRRSLNQLAKLETSETKSIEAMHKLSLLTTRNKLNLFQTHALASSQRHAQDIQLRVRQEQVREIKQREEHERKQIREELKRNKENERQVVRNNSLKYEDMIRQNRRLELEKKGQLVQDAKHQKQLAKDSLLHSRLQDKQNKELVLFNTTLAKIETQPSLAKELTRLLRQKEEMEQRVAQRREDKEKIRLEIDRLKHLKEEEVAILAIKKP